MSLRFRKPIYEELKVSFCFAKLGFQLTLTLALNKCFFLLVPIEVNYDVT